MIAFLKTLYMSDYTDRCQREYVFTLAAGSALELGQKGIAMLEANLVENYTPWTSEDSAEAIVGTGQYVLSATRRNFHSWGRDAALNSVRLIKGTIKNLIAQIVELKAAQSMNLKAGLGRAVVSTIKKKRPKSWRP